MPEKPGTSITEQPLLTRVLLNSFYVSLWIGLSGTVILYNKCESLLLAAAACCCCCCADLHCLAGGSLRTTDSRAPSCASLMPAALLVGFDS